MSDRFHPTVDLRLPVFTCTESWFPLWADNLNAPPGQALVPLSFYRRVHVAAVFVTVMCPAPASRRADPASCALNVGFREDRSDWP